jgi:ribonuclease HI
VNYLVYTDGSCSAKDRVGGYAWKVVGEDGDECIGGGSEVDTTISRMELMAAISALESLINDAFWQRYDGEETVVLVISDSEHVVLGFNIKTRARNKNRDLWERLEAAASEFTLVEFQHVKGHAGHTDNEECDKLAGEFRQAALQGVSHDEA